MIRRVVALLVVLGLPISIAHAQSEQEIDPATLAVLHDPPRLQLRISVVERDLRGPSTGSPRCPTALRGASPSGSGSRSRGRARSPVLSELGHGLGCGVGSLFGRTCDDPRTPSWIIATVIAGAPVILAGLVTLLAGVGQLDSIASARSGKTRSPIA